MARAQRRFGIKNATLNFLRQSSVNNGTSNHPSEIDIPSDDDLKNSKNQIQRPTQLKQIQSPSLSEKCFFFFLFFFLFFGE